jgi:hypothetical protein
VSVTNSDKVVDPEETYYMHLRLLLLLLFSVVAAHADLLFIRDSGGALIAECKEICSNLDIPAPVGFKVVNFFTEFGIGDPADVHLIDYVLITGGGNPGIYTISFKSFNDVLCHPGLRTIDGFVGCLYSADGSIQNVGSLSFLSTNPNSNVQELSYYLRFQATSSVPEPGSLPLLASCILATLACVLRKRPPH